MDDPINTLKAAHPVLKYCRVEIPDQWAPSVHTMMGRLYAAGFDPKVDRMETIKERFGQLRVYFGVIHDPSIEDTLEDIAEKASIEAQVAFKCNPLA